jgi:hypothetical protein
MSTLNAYAHQIETICQQHQVTPSALAGPSRSAYAWMKFLTDEHNLQLHLDSLQHAIAIGTEIIHTQKQGVGELHIEFCHGSSLFKYSTNRNLTNLRMSEGFIRSSDEIMTAVLQSALLGKAKASTL